MSCSPFDLKDYFLKELPHPQALQVEAHVRNCQSCREELDRLRLTEAALFALRDEEIPQRIAFVSDQVFEPSPLRRWWAAFWNSAPRLGFASAAMLSAALVCFAFVHRTPQPAAPQPPRIIQASISTPEVQSLIQQAVAQAVRDSEARQDQKTGQLVAELERSYANARQSASLAAYWETEAKRQNVIRRAYYGPPAATPGDLQ